MIINKIGNILKATENIICHQVNIDGVMGGGLAKQIASTYPNVEKAYQEHCKLCKNKYEILKLPVHNLFLYEINKNKIIANCFSQNHNFDTDYETLKECFNTLMLICKDNNYTIAVPYKYGCGIANGDWNIVSKIFDDLSNKYGIDISIYKLEK